MPAREFIHALVWYKRHLIDKHNGGEISIIRQFVQDGDICFDIGAHAGFWTKPLSRLVTKGHVYAFEALPYYARVLKIVVRLLRLNNVTVINKAVLDRDDTVALAWKDKDGKRLTGCTHLATAHEKAGEYVTTDSIALDSLLSDIPVSSRVSLVKIDIEGAELMALRGAVGLIETFRPVFYLEVVSDYCKRYDYTPADLFNFLAGFGYEAYTVFSSDAEAIVKPTRAAIYAGKGDVLFVPSEYAFCRCHNKT